MSDITWFAAMPSPALPPGDALRIQFGEALGGVLDTALEAAPCGLEYSAIVCAATMALADFVATLTAQMHEEETPDDNA